MLREGVVRVSRGLVSQRGPRERGWKDSAFRAVHQRRIAETQQGLGIQSSLDEQFRFEFAHFFLEFTHATAVD